MLLLQTAEKNQVLDAWYQEVVVTCGNMSKRYAIISSADSLPVSYS